MDTICWFMFLARPEPSSPDFSSAGGGFINAWVAHSDAAIAEQIAREAISEELWRVEHLEEQALVTRQTYKDTPESLEHFEQAVADGHCLAFYVWPPEGEDIDEKSSA
jgi:hypothetical protein